MKHCKIITQNTLKLISIQEKMVNEARRWIGTPFHAQGSRRDIGCDCFGLIMGVAREIGAKSVSGRYLWQYYVDDYDYLQDSIQMIELFNLHLTPQLIGKIGDVVVVRIGRNHWHAGIISNAVEIGDTMIHVCIKQKIVIEHNINTWIHTWGERVKYFSIN